MDNDIRQILNMVERGQMSAQDALLKIKTAPFEDLGYAKVDLHRKVRQGAQEVIYGAGKSAGQIAGIVKSMLDNGQDRILITRIDPVKYELMNTLLGEFRNEYRSEYNKAAEIAFIGTPKVADGIGKIVVATGGTSDMKVAEEAAFTAEHMGNEVVRLYDVGVSGIHRLLAHNEELMSASVIIAIAGMEGALASVIGGLADCPVIAVPTSVGYGAAFEGLTALLSMLNSCASGVSVVNIDNGFGAGYLAHMINHMGYHMTTEDK